MKKIFTYLLAGLSLLSFSRCDSLDIEPTSSLAGNRILEKPGPIHCVQYRTACFTSRKKL